MTENFSYGVIPILKRKGLEPLFLLINSADYWGFPKGHKENDESDLAAARRELLEETGIAKIDILAKPALKDEYIFTLHDITYLKTVTFYLGILNTEPQLHLQEKEVSNSKWCNFSEAMETLSFDNLKKILAEAQKYL